MLSGCSGRGREGFILVSVLLLCVMLVATATAYAWFARIQIKVVFQEKLALQARGIAFVMAQEVMKGLKLDTNEFDSPIEPWFQPMIVPLKDYGVANVILKPLDNKIPLQHLFLPDGNTLRDIPRFQKVWDKMWGELEERWTTLPAKVLDFIDKDTIPRVGGKDGPENINRNLLDISELLGVPEVTPELLYGDPPKLGIVDYCTMWSDVKMNINVAEPHVLALLPELNRNLIEEIIKFREKNAIASFDDLSSIPGMPLGSAINYIIDFKSSYYNLIIELLDESWNSTRYFDIVFLKKDGSILSWEEK